MVIEKGNRHTCKKYGAIVKFLTKLIIYFFFKVAQNNKTKIF